MARSGSALEHSSTRVDCTTHPACPRLTAASASPFFSDRCHPQSHPHALSHAALSSAGVPVDGESRVHLPITPLRLLCSSRSAPQHRQAKHHQQAAASSLASCPRAPASSPIGARVLDQTLTAARSSST
jgi:hypothetical protein